jgi:hypothetical protein
VAVVFTPPGGTVRDQWIFAKDTLKWIGDRNVLISSGRSRPPDAGWLVSAPTSPCSPPRSAWHARGCLPQWFPDRRPPVGTGAVRSLFEGAQRVPAMPSA